MGCNPASSEPEILIVSNISNRHSVVPFVAGKTNPLAEQRLAKVGYKTTKKQQAKFRSVAVSVPMVDMDQITEDQNSRLRPFLQTLIETAQDGIIRSLYESSDGTLQSVADDEINIDACISFLQAEAAGERLKKEHIESWFDSELSDSLFILVAEKLGFKDTEPNEDQTKTIQKHVKIYRDVLSMLAGGKTWLQPPQIRGCKTALSLVDCDSGIPQKLMNRLEQMERKPDMVELLEL